MCKPDVDNSLQRQAQQDAATARAEEEARQARITAGTAQIDDTFGGFDDGFFNGYRDSILNFSQPQLDRQFGDARDELTFSLARAGTLNSSVAGQKQAELTSAYDTSMADLLANAQNQTNSLRGQVENERSSLLSLLNATGDADRASNEALSRSQVLFEAQPDYSLLPDIFSGVASGIGAFSQNQQRQQVLDTYFGGSNSSGSSRIVR